MAGGRSQVEPMERLVLILATLTHSGAHGVPVERLLDASGFPDDDSGRDQLRRELRHLAQQGYEVTNTGDEGTGGRYVLQAHDNRMHTLLTVGERAALENALAQAADVVADTPAHLDRLMRAVDKRCLVRFTYKSKPRVVHPYLVQSSPSGWALRGRAEGDEITKSFIVGRMSEVAIDEPGTAEAAPSDAHKSFDPLTWQEEAPVEVELETTPEHAAEVTRVMSGLPVDVGRSDSVVRLRMVVTNRNAFLGRLFDLGSRAHLASPPQLRTALLEQLRARAGG